MIHIYLILIGIIIIILTRRMYHHNFELFLCILIPINFEFFHLVPRIGKFDQYREVLLIIIIFYLFEEYFVKIALKKNRPINIRSYGKFIALYFLIAIMGIWFAFSMGQNFIYCIKAFKYFPLLLTYFLVIKKKVNIDKFMFYFIFMAVCVALFTLVQYFSFEKLLFYFQYEDSISHTRGLDSLRGLRILEGNTVITIGLLISFTKWLKTRKTSFLFITLFFLIHFSIVIKTRTVLASIVLIIFFTSFYYNRNNMRTIIKYLFLIIIGILFVFLSGLHFSDILINHGMIAETISDFQGNISDKYATGSLNTRILCYQYYWTELQNFWITGRGLLNISWPGHPDFYLNEHYNYHLSDIGVFHVLLTFGVIGGSLLITFVIITILKVPKIIDFFPEVACYFMLGLIMLPQIDLFFRTDHMFIFSIFAAFMDISLKSVSNKNIPYKLNLYSKNIAGFLYKDRLIRFPERLIFKD